MPASELAQRAGITASTTSSHLRKLLEAEWATMQRRGRQRYYRLTSPQVARLLEQALCLAPPVTRRSLRGQQQAAALRLARSCYDHLAGQLGVALTEALVRQDMLRIDGSDFVDVPARARSGPAGRRVAASGVRAPLPGLE